MITLRYLIPSTNTKKCLQTSEMNMADEKLTKEKATKKFWKVGIK